MLRGYEGQLVDDPLLKKMAEELKAALAMTIGSWDWVCVHQPAIVWFNSTTGERTRPRVEGKRLVDILDSGVVAELLSHATKATQQFVGKVVDSKEMAEAAVLQAVLSLGNWVCKYRYGGCQWYNTQTGKWAGLCDCDIIELR